jgi:low affinity Fe/Cu permease
MEKILKFKLSKLAAAIANPYTFFIVLLGMVAWVIYGYFAGYSDVWVTLTTLGLSFITFLVVFIVQFSE